MKLLVVYAGKTGTTEKAAALLGKKLVMLNADVDVYDLCNDTPSPKGYDGVAVGGSIRMGMLHAKAKRFLVVNEEKLLPLPFGVFCCRCGTDDTRALLAKSVPEKLLARAADAASFGGEMDINTLRGFDRFVAKMVSKSDSAGTFHSGGIQDARIDAFAKALVSAASHA